MNDVSGLGCANM